MRLRAGTKARLAYLLPQEQGDDSLGSMGVAGFQAIYAPFCGECRSIDDPAKASLQPTPEQQQLATKIVKKMTIKFSLDSYKNPEQRTYFSAVEALALEYEKPEEVDDPLGKCRTVYFIFVPFLAV